MDGWIERWMDGWTDGWEDPSSEYECTATVTLIRRKNLLILILSFFKITKIEVNY